MPDFGSKLQTGRFERQSITGWLRKAGAKVYSRILKMINPTAVSIMEQDQVSERAAVIREWDKLYCDAIRAFRRGQGNVQLQTFTDDGSIQPDALVLVVTGKVPAAEMFYVISALMDAWDRDELPGAPQTDKK